MELPIGRKEGEEQVFGAKKGEWAIHVPRGEPGGRSEVGRAED